MRSPLDKLRIADLEDVLQQIIELHESGIRDFPFRLAAYYLCQEALKEESGDGAQSKDP